MRRAMGQGRGPGEGHVSKVGRRGRVLPGPQKELSERKKTHKYYVMGAVGGSL